MRIEIKGTKTLKIQKPNAVIMYSIVYSEYTCTVYRQKIVLCL